jgi:hypothetical protein
MEIVSTQETSSARRCDMSRHLPYGGMPLAERLGVVFSRAEDGCVEGTWRPAAESCNPNGGCPVILICLPDSGDPGKEPGLPDISRR